MLSLSRVLIVMLILILVASVPLIVQWMLNTLFHLGLAYNFVNWFATLLLCAMLIALNSL